MVQMLLLTCIPLVLDMSSFCLEVICIRLWEDNQNNLRILRHTWAPFVNLPSFLSRSVYTAFWFKFLSPVESHFLKCGLVFGHMLGLDHEGLLSLHSVPLLQICEMHIYFSLSPGAVLYTTFSPFP